MNHVNIDNLDWDKEIGGFRSIRRNKVKETLDEIYGRQEQVNLFQAKIDEIIQSEYGGASPEVQYALLRVSEKIKALIQ